MLTFIIYYLLLLKKLNDIFFQGYWLLHLLSNNWYGDSS